jgi:hypothetical protein
LRLGLVEAAGAIDTARMIRRLLPLVFIFVLVTTAPAYAAHSFVLARAAAKPNVVVDRGGTRHFVWARSSAPPTWTMRPSGPATP